MVLGLLVGLVLAVCVAFVRDHMDPRITMPDDVRTALGLSYVGLIPKVRRKLLGNGDTPLIGQTVPPVFGEAIRDVRTRVVMGPAQPLQSVMVASATSGEGKTMIAANLALSLAQLGSRVLLVDVDLRRPRLHRVFNVAQSPGLSDLLTRAATVTDTVQQITAAGPLWVLPAGRPPVNPADLLGSAPFGEFLKTLPDWFDYVVLDVPPVLAVADASIVAPMVSGVLLVISADRTVKIAARGALDRLESAGAVLIGGVLNRADLERDRHAYEPYYSGAYADYAYTGALAGSREQQTEGVVVDERRR
jgi:capsular exopolysaccharide synthesis family protein